MPITDVGKYRRAFEDMAPEEQFPEFKAKFPDVSDEELQAIWNWLCRAEGDDASVEPQAGPATASESDVVESLAHSGFRKHVDGSHSRLRRTPSVDDWLEALGMSHNKFRLWLNQEIGATVKGMQREAALSSPSAIFDLRYRAKGKMKPVGQSLVEADYKSFAEMCERLGLSVRGGLHIAMKAMVEAFPPTSDAGRDLKEPW